MARERIEAMGKKSGVVGTLMTNFALEKRFAELGIPFERAKVGDRYVMERLLEKGWLYGGESSGHLIALDCQTTGDGIVSALQVLAAVVSSGKTLAELTADKIIVSPKGKIFVRAVAMQFDRYLRESDRAGGYSKIA